MELIFIGIGLLIGMIGTILGAGGGFLAIPILILFLNIEPLYAAGTSLLFVVLNGFFGTVSYIRYGKVDIKNGIKFSLLSFLGILLGVYIAFQIEPRTFQLIFGILVIILALWMIWKNSLGKQQSEESYSFNWSNLNFNKKVLGFCSLTGIGIISSLMGIGGGPFMVPILIYILGFPVKWGVPTSQFVVTCIGFISVLFYIFNGYIIWSIGINLVLGAVIGAPLGAFVSNRMPSKKLVYLLSTVLLFIGIQFLY